MFGASHRAIALQEEVTGIQNLHLSGESGLSHYLNGSYIPEGRNTAN